MISHQVRFDMEAFYKVAGRGEHEQIETHVKPL